MIKPVYYFLFLPVTLLAALCTDQGISSKFVCIRDSIEVFQNVASTSLEREITLYKLFGNNSETIAVWIMQNFSNKDIIHDKYKQRVSFENGTIFLQHFQASDEATYVLLYHESSKRSSVQLCERVPPTLRCKPNVKHIGNLLIASLDKPEYCGKPLASVRWMEYPGVSNISKYKIELPPGNQAGTYIACIEGETLNCVKKSSEWDNCESIRIEPKAEDIVPTTSEILQWKADTIVGVTITSLVLLLGVVALLVKQFWKQCGIGSKHVTVGGDQTDNVQPMRQGEVVDTEDGHSDQERESFVARDEIPMQEL